MPNECCPAVPVEGPIGKIVFEVVPQNFQHVVQPPITGVPSVRYAEVMLHSGVPAIGTTANPLFDPSVVLHEAGRGNMTIDTYGGQVRSIPMPVVESGLIGLGNLYHSQFVVDMSAPAWNGTGTHLRSAGTAYDLPVPWMNAADLDGGGYAVQPRPGTMPGLYILQVGNNFYHYGSPLDSGANPQTTAVYLEGNVVEPSGGGGGEEDEDDDESSEKRVALPTRRGPSASDPRLPTVVIRHNQLTGAWLYWFPGSGNPGYIEVRHVDGTVARFDWFNPYVSTWTPPGPTRTLWRLTEVRDPYDNVATYAYNSTHQLTSITFPSGISQHFTWSSSATSSPAWPNSTSGYDRLEISYQYNGSLPSEVASRTWGLVFESNGSSYGGRHFGGRLFRTYSPSRNTLADLSAAGPYTSVASASRTVQIVHEFTYVPASTSNPDIMIEAQRAHSGTPFDATISSPSDLPDRSLLQTNYTSSGRVDAQIRSMTGETLLFSYPTAARTTDLLTGTVLWAIEVENENDTSRRYEFDVHSGRVYSVITSAPDTALGRPRKQHVSTDNSSIGGVASTDFEPEWIEVYNIFGTTCSCQKPSERQIRSRRSGTTHTRTTTFEYHANNKMVTKRVEQNPQAGSGTIPSTVEWNYTYQQLGTSTSWGAWVLASESTPDGTYTYSHSDLLTRANSDHGQMARTSTKSLGSVRTQTSLTGSAATSSTPIVETIWRNLSNLPSGLPKMGNPAGQVRKVIDGDGVETVFEYSTSGYLTAQIVGGDLKTTHTVNSFGESTATTENALSAIPAATTITRMAGVGIPTEISSTSSGVLRETRLFYDRFGHRTVVQQNNLDSTGNGPSKHGSSSSARTWVETQNHYHHTLLTETYEDRKPLDEAAGGSQFLVTQFDYGADGRLATVTNPNGSVTTFDFDGYGTLYRSVTTHSGTSEVVRSPKTFVNPFLELTGSYEHTGSDHLWTTIVRNAAGAITQITEPSTTAPTGYSPVGSTNYATGGAVHQFEIDVLGRMTKATALSGSTVLTVRELRYDQLGRTIWQRDEEVGTSDSHHMRWQFKAGKATQVEEIERTGIAKSTYTFNSLGLLTQVQDGFGAGNLVAYSYRNYTPFLQTVTRTDLDPITTTRTTTTGYLTNALGEVTSILDGSSPALTHTYGRNSFGNVDRYTDPKSKLQKFLLDAQGRTVEHVRVGDSSDFIHNSSVFADGDFSDGRTKLTRADGLGNVTVTHWDLAGRPFIVQNPGGNTAPTASAKHQSMSLFAEYDGASRLKALYDGDLGKTEFYRDGPGRVILRQLVNTTAGGQSSEEKISQWNTKDWLRRDALGRIGHHAYQGTADGSVLLGVEAFEQDSLGRVKAEKYESVFAPSHVLEARSSFAAGSTLRSGLDYKDSLALQDVQLDFGRDAIGRLTEVQWDRAPGGSGMDVLAQYGWAGGVRRTRDVRYSSSSYPEGRSTFTFDVHGRLTQIQDNVYTASSTFTTKSQFDYEYDDASNLTKEKYTKVNGRVGDRFAYDAWHRLQHAWQGVDSATMAASGNPGTYSSSSVTEQIDYDLDAANNRESTVSTTAVGTSTTPYERQDGSHPQGPSNRYAGVTPPNAPTDVFYEYDGRGNLIYDGRFSYRYDYLNRLQQVWRVVPNDTANEENARYQPVEEGSLDEAREAVKLEVPDLYTRLLREHKDPTFRARLKATISGGVIRITPTPQGGADPRFLPIDGTLELAAVYVYDAFNRRVASALIGIDTYFHVWDGWRQVSEHTLHYVGSAWQATPTKQFVWGSRLDELVSYRRNVGASWETYYLLHGGQDTAAKLVNSSGVVVEQYEYDPYGRVTVYDGSGALVDLGPSGSSPEDGTASAKGLPFLWKGIRLDEITGLLQMRNRYYSVELGRFLTNDPLGVWYDAVNCGNGYDYVGSCPVCLGDPLGMQTEMPPENRLSPTPPTTSQGREIGPRSQTNPAHGADTQKALETAFKYMDLMQSVHEADNPFYNCHGFTMLGKRGWLDTPGVETALEDDYHPSEAETPRVGDLAVYRAWVCDDKGNWTFQIVHTARVVRVIRKMVLLRSKFGLGPFGDHFPEDVPETYKRPGPTPGPGEPPAEPPRVDYYEPNGKGYTISTGGLA